MGRSHAGRSLLTGETRIVEPDTSIHCSCCGRRWRVPDPVHAGSAYVCGECGQMLDASAATARPRALSPGSWWATLLGSTLWLPLLLAVSAIFGTANHWLFLGLAVPYVGGVHGLLLRRRDTPSEVWTGYLWLGLGTYATYLWGVLRLWLRAPSRDYAGVALFGLVGIVSGAMILVRYRRRARRLPKLDQPA